VKNKKPREKSPDAIKTASYLYIAAIIELSKKPLSGFEDQRHHRAPSFSFRGTHQLARL
jgi:hypothetical protein